ncbi:MAG: sporulation protein YabP [Firmicutes bacterium]|jgi:sporulation protein YabP|nr:sporulation protein YabP [Bacillota bacterium]NBI62639.1 sporulation protein YabP [Clostridiales bacterium]
MENHMITIDNREKITVTDVADIDNFDEEEIRANLKAGGLNIKGKKLHIQMLDLAEGKAVITGEVNSLAYTQKKDKSEKGLLKKILK